MASNWVCELLAHFPDARETKPGEWLACCPAHGDKHPSLSITLKTDPIKGDRMLLHCFSQNCHQDAILAAIGLDWRSLLPPKAPDHTSAVQTNGHRRNGKERGQIVATYPYVDAGGKLLYEVIRYEPKRFIQRAPDGHGGWSYKLDGVPRVLYRLHEAIAAVASGQTVCLAEGEKDVDNLRDLGFTATCNAGGAGKGKEEHSEALRGARVVILPDNDDAGSKHRDELGKALQGVASRVQVLHLPRLPEKGDVSDWLKAGGTAEELRRLIETAPDWSAHDWEAIVPFGEYSLPAFPLDALPAWVRNYVEAVSAATQTPPGLAGMMVLAVIALAGARRCRVHLVGEWYEPVNLYCLSILPSGERKSPVYRAITEPVREFEREVNAERSARIAQAQTDLRILQGRQKHAEEMGAKDKDRMKRDEAAEEARSLAAEIEAFKVPSALRLLADDVTPEKLASLLAEQGERLAILSPEGGIFETFAGRYSQGVPNLDVFLKGYSSDPVTVDRIGRPPLHINDPALTLGLAVQPDVLQGLKDKPGFHGRGLLARFLYSLPTSRVGYRSTEAPSIPQDVTAAYQAGLRRLLEMEPRTSDTGQERPLILHLDRDALYGFNAFRAAVEVALQPGNELSDMRGWANKLCGNVARLAGILHIAEHGLTSETIRSRTIEASIRLGKYFVEHAKASFCEMGVDADTDNARYILAWIRRNDKRQFTKREAHYALQGRFKRADALDRPIAVLTERNYIRSGESEERAGAGRKPSPVFEVSPLMTELTQ